METVDQLLRDGRAARGKACLIVEKPRDVDAVAVAETSHIGHEILTDGKGLIALGARLFRQTARIDVQFVRRRERDIFPQMSDDFVHQQNDGRAKTLHIVHGHHRQIECLAHTPRRERDDRVVAVRAPTHLHHIALRRRGRLSCRGTDALHIYHDARDLRTRRIADQLLFQREAGAARRVHHLCTRERCAEDCPHRADLVLHLEECAADLRQQLCHLFGNLRGRRDRIAREECHTGSDRALGDRLVALHEPCTRLRHLTPSSLRISQNRDSASRTARTRCSPRGGRA